MTLPPFQLHRPTTLDEASALLDRFGDAAAPYCGGTELLLLLKLRLAAFDHLVDLKGIDELAGVRVEDGALRIGAAVTHRALEREPLVLERLPALAAMERRVANIRVRSAGTLGGNLCFADPRSDPATFLLALDALAECRRGGGKPRRLPLAEFLIGPYQTALEQGEMLTAVRVPLPPPGSVLVHDKLAFRERPAVTVTSLVRVEQGRVAEARVAVGSAGPRPVRAVEAEASLLGLDARRPDGAALAEAGAAAASACGAVDDAHGSAEYKRHLVSVLVQRSVRSALEAA